MALGFLKLGILDIATLDSELPALEGQRLDAWLDSDQAADMHWMARWRELRKQPGTIMDGAKSLICVAFNYHRPDVQRHNERTDRLKIAQYAAGEDYHHTLRQKLKALLRFIQETASPVPVKGRVCVDSAPVLEKAMAVRAGLGWQGRHSNLITREAGSWVFLAELFVDIALSPTQNAPVSQDFCGSCTRCVEACPTDAINGQTRSVDARACLSYWTIENHDASLPAEITQNLNGWAFGCDICQQVCPWNIRFGTATQEPAFATPALPPPDEFSMQALLNTRPKHTPLKRAGLTQLERNHGAQP